MLAGVAYAIGACFLWGLAFIGPLVLADMPPALIACGRYAVYGLWSLALMLAMDRAALLRSTPRLWLQALVMTALGNFLYYIALAAALQFSGVTLPTLIIGLLPLSVSLGGLLLERRRISAGLIVALLLILAGMLLANLHPDPLSLRGEHYWTGIALATLALLIWTAFALVNARILKSGAVESRAWAGMLGVAGLPLALAGLALQGDALTALPAADWARTLVVWIALGVLASWFGFWLWNHASHRLSTSTCGQLIVFETIAAFIYAMLLHRQWMSAEALIATGLLIAGVLVGLRTESRTAVRLRDTGAPV